MFYGAGELQGVPAGPDGVLTVDRDADDLFRPETLASFVGAPVTIDHPPEFVTPANFRQFVAGTTINVRRGTGDQADLMLADLIIQHPMAIAEIRSGRREVSNGYDADYETTAPGKARQRNIIGNHVALVARGRCGSRCAIGDKEPTMSLMQKLKAAFKTQDAAAFDEAMAEAEKVEQATKDAEAQAAEEAKKEEKAKETTDAITTAVAALLEPINVRLAALDAAVKPVAPVHTADAAPVTAEAFTAFRANAEIVSPGVSAPTFDAAAPAAQTRDAICDCQRRALQTAYGHPAGKAAILPFLQAGETSAFSTMDAARVATIFDGAAALMRVANNTARQTGAGATFDHGSRRPSPADVNRINREAWAKKPQTGAI